MQSDVLSAQRRVDPVRTSFAGRPGAAKKLVEKAEKRVDKGVGVSYTNQAASRGAAARTEKT